MEAEYLKFTLNEKDLNDAFLKMIKPLVTDKDLSIYISVVETSSETIEASGNAKALSFISENKTIIVGKGTPSGRGAGGGEPPKSVTIIFA